MSNKHHIGKSVNTIEASKEFLPYTKVVIIAGEDESGTQRVYEAGNDTGRTLEVTNPWGTQQIANDMLIRIQGYTYKPYSARGAYLPDTAELGDGVTVNNIYSVLAIQDLTFDSLAVSDIEAPGADETENEFGIYVDNTQKDLKRKVNTISTKFTVELGKIESEINDPANGLSTRITQNTNSITSEVTRATGAEGTLSNRITHTAESLTSEITSTKNSLSSRIDQRLDNITLQVSSAGGSSTFTIKDGSTTLDTKTFDMTVDAVNISGKLTASQINTNGLEADSVKSSWVYTGDLNANQITSGYITAGQIQVGVIPTSTSDLTNDSGFVNSTDVTTITENTITTTNVYARNLQVAAANISGTLTAGAIDSGSVSLGGCGYMYLRTGSSAPYAMEVSSFGALALTASSGDIYASATGYITLAPGSEVSVGGNIRPTTDGTWSCGISWSRWSDVYATNATIQTSDLQRKKDVEYGLEAFDKFFDGMNPCTYRFKDGHGRKHFGLIAQDIEDLIDECGLDTMDVAAFIKSWDEENQVYDYALRYGEFIPLIIWEVQQLKRKLEGLENERAS